MGRLHGKKIATQREAMNEVIEWLTFYNHRRLHSTPGYVNPMTFEASWHAGQAKKGASLSGYGLTSNEGKVTPWIGTGLRQP